MESDNSPTRNQKKKEQTASPRKEEGSAQKGKLLQVNSHYV